MVLQKKKGHHPYYIFNVCQVKIIPKGMVRNGERKKVNRIFGTTYYIVNIINRI